MKLKLASSTANPKPVQPSQAPKTVTAPNAVETVKAPASASKSTEESRVLAVRRRIVSGNPRRVLFRLH